MTIRVNLYIMTGLNHLLLKFLQRYLCSKRLLSNPIDDDLWNVKLLL